MITRLFQYLQDNNKTVIVKSGIKKNNEYIPHTTIQVIQNILCINTPTEYIGGIKVDNITEAKIDKDGNILIEADKNQDHYTILLTLYKQITNTLQEINQ